jgi:hypothetical protein
MGERGDCGPPVRGFGGKAAEKKIDGFFSLLFGGFSAHGLCQWFSNYD